MRHKRTHTYIPSLESIPPLENTQYSNRILNILSEQNTATEMQLHFYVRRLLENR